MKRIWKENSYGGKNEIRKIWKRWSNKEGKDEKGISEEGNEWRKGKENRN